jgi:hypothetical protein
MATLLPTTLKALQHIIDINSTDQQIFDSPAQYGRYMLAVYFDNKLLTALDFVIFPGRAILTIHYQYNLSGAKRSDFPVEIPINEVCCFAGNHFIFDYYDDNLYVRSTVDIQNVYFQCIIIPSAHPGTTVTGLDYVIENTSGNGIHVNSNINFHAGLEVTPKIGIVNFIDSTNIEWINTNAVAKRVGSIVYISFTATLNSVNSGVDANTIYDLCEITPNINFNNAFQSYGNLSISGGMVFTVSNLNNCILQIQLPMSIPVNTSQEIKGSITYIF